MAENVISQIDRELARRLFGRYVRLSRPWYDIAPHHELMFEHLQQVHQNEIRFLVISMPPRHGKSETASLAFAEYELGVDPTTEVILAGHSSGLVNEFSRKIRRHVRENLTYRQLFKDVVLDPERSKIDDWRTVQGGGLRAVGVEGGVTGRGADLLLIDDPVKEGDEQSPAALQKTWNWYISAARTRLSPRGRVVITMTRWHPYDLAGRVLRMMLEEEAADQFVELRLPALASEGDILGRKPGEALWPERFSERDLRAMEAADKSYFLALYQQTPPMEDSPMFYVENFIRESVVVDDSQQWVWAIDAAITDKETSDYNVFTPFRRDGDEIVVGDMVRFMGESPKVERELRKLMDAHPTHLFVFPKQLIELILFQNLSEGGYGNVMRQVSLPGDKRGRASLFASWVSWQRVRVSDSKAMDYWIREHCEFGAIGHDDCVDTSSVITHHWGLRNLMNVFAEDRDEREVMVARRQRRHNEFVHAAKLAGG
jgi:hypothetical protein